MASAPPQLPLFYNVLEPLSSNAHGNFKTRAADSAPFLAKAHAVPITVDEFRTLNRCLDTGIAEAVTEHTRLTALKRAREARG